MNAAVLRREQRASRRRVLALLTERRLATTSWTPAGPTGRPSGAPAPTSAVDPAGRGG